MTRFLHLTEVHQTRTDLTPRMKSNRYKKKSTRENGFSFFLCVCQFCQNLWQIALQILPQRLHTYTHSFIQYLFWGENEAMHGSVMCSSR